MAHTDLNCKEFVDILSSKEPVPGGGGASALVGAMGIALGNMVANLTVGKKKYASVQDDIQNIKRKADLLQSELLKLVEEDAAVFEPLSQAYSMPTETQEQKLEKEKVMEAALKKASRVPMEIMRKCCEAIRLHEELAEKGTAIAISDVGVGVLFCKAALMGAHITVLINTKYMKDSAFAGELEHEAESMAAEYSILADEIAGRVKLRVKGG
ncbi:MAG: Methenyltetrahydrofolate cyclohydrolase [Firmicutes bacterium ADurb.Bin182]|nr:MAG: Methenyltetrahydrofolate cyclohydrolase [Firmicutes bacterium ADurb.Bin182]